MRRVGICRAAETLLVNRQCAAEMLPAIADDLIAVDALHADADHRNDCGIDACHRRLVWNISPDLSVKLVDDVDAAMAHIRQYGSDHTNPSSPKMQDRRKIPQWC